MPPPAGDDTEEIADLLLRRLSRADPESLARALLPDAGAVKVHGWPDTQVASKQRRLDRLLEVTAKGTRRLLHVEWQWRWERALPWRVCEYQHLAVSAFREAGLSLPVQSVVVLLSGRRAPWPAFQRLRLSPPGEPFSGVRFRVEAVYQRAVAELLARPGLLWPLFAPLARDAEPSHMPEALRALRERATTHAQYSDFAAAMAVLGERDPREGGLGDAVLSLLPQEVLLNNTIFNMGREKGRAEGKAEGNAEGKAQGLAEGKAEGKAEGNAEGKAQGLAVGILTVLTARGLPVSAAQRARITRERDLASLDRWLLRALEVATTRDLFATPRGAHTPRA